MLRLRCTVAAVVALGAVSAVGVSASAPASATPARAAASPTAASPSAARLSAAHCDPWQVVTADWLKVHTSPSAKSSAVGQLPRLANFEACSYRKVGNIVWLYGSGYNGSKKLTGWVDSDYMASY